MAPNRAPVDPKSLVAESGQHAESRHLAGDPAGYLPSSEHLEEIAALPRDVGWFLLVVGLLSELGAPGVPPFWIIGIMILWPRIGARMGSVLQRRAPKLFTGCVRMVRRYASDLESRYPHRR